MDAASERWPRVKAIFQDALDRDPALRPAFVAAACAGDAALEADVESLLAAHATGSTTLESAHLRQGFHLRHGSGGQVGGQASEREQIGAFDLEDAVIGAYRVIRKIGEGGMGAVYLASRIDDFEQQVAIKVVAPVPGQGRLVDRFRHERQTLAGLEHPNIARLLDGGATASGLPYFVMELVTGQRIDRYCDDHQLSTPARLELFRTVCSAVHYAHQKLIVHRDIKPDNILVTADGVPKLLDFGIATVIEPDTLTATQGVTRSRGGPMTPEYASPEQIRSEPITTASDIYSLGVLLFQLLTGARPYRLERGTFDEIVHATCEQEPVLPSLAATSKALRRRLAGDLDAIVLRALNKLPAARYATVDQFSEDVRRHLAGLPVIAERDAFTYRARKFIARRKAIVAAAATSVLALLVAVAVTTWQARIAVRERDRATLEAVKAAQINGFLQDMLASADPYVEGKDVTVAQTLDRAASRIDGMLERQPEVAAAVRATIGNTYVNLGLVEAAEPLLRRALADRVRAVGPDHPDIARSLVDLAYVLSERGAVDEAAKMYLASLDMYRRLGLGGDGAAIAPLQGLGRLEQWRSDENAAEARYREALAIARRVPDGERWIAESLNNIAVIRQSRADLAEAEGLYREALAIIGRQRGDESPEMATALTNLSGVLASRRSFAEAEPMSARALAMRRKVLGENHPDVAYALFNHADLVATMGRHAEAIGLSREVLARRGTTLPDDHPMVSGAMLVLGRSLTAEGNAAAGLPYLREALARRKVMLPEGHWLLANTTSTLGETLVALGRFAEAEPLLVNSYERLRADRGERHERTIDALRRVIKLYDASKQPARADHYRRILAQVQPSR